VKPALDYHQTDILDCCFWGSRHPDDASRPIDTLRLILPELDLTEMRRRLSYTHLFSYHSLDIPAWLWVNAAFHLHGSDLIALRISLAKSFVACYSSMDFELNDRVSELLVELMDVEMIELYKAGGYALLPSLFTRELHFVDSEHVGREYVGRIFLQLLTKLGIDVETCVRREIDKLPPGVLFPYDSNPRSWIFERLEDDMEILRWEWNYDTSMPGYQVVAEFSALAGDAYTRFIESQWPFTDFSWREDENRGLSRNPYDFTTSKEVARFERRTATKARKERARSGQKRARSRMPGAWV